MEEDWEVGSVQILEILDEGRRKGGRPCEKNLDWVQARAGDLGHSSRSSVEKRESEERERGGGKGQGWDSDGSDLSRKFGERDR